MRPTSCDACGSLVIKKLMDYYQCGNPECGKLLDSIPKDVDKPGMVVVSLPSRKQLLQMMNGDPIKNGMIYQGPAPIKKK